MPDLDVHLAGIALRDEGAFTAWMAGAEPAIRQSLKRFPARVDVESVVQETLLRIWQIAARHRPEGRPDSLLRFALRIARNLAIGEAQRLGREVPYEEPPDSALDQHLVRDATPDPLLRRVLLRCLAKLPGRSARALHARLSASGERDDDLAASLGMAVNTFRQNISRARRAIEACLARNGVSLAEVRQ